jgi:outer membrane protein OmpA-like peptidoglycan-associated protein
MRLGPAARATRGLARRLVFGALLVGGSPLTAQQRYGVELSLAAGLHQFDKKTELSTGAGVAGRVGYWFWGPFSVEGELSYARPKTDTPLQKRVETTTVAGWLLLNQRIGRSSSVFIKGGYGTTGYGSCPAVSVPGSGPCGSSGVLQGGIGGRFGISRNLLLRYDATINRSLTTLKFSNLALQAGVSLMLGSKPMGDADGDGVSDRSDRCASTPKGSQVDSRGCPSDQDRDGVPDGVDRCPDTPTGARPDGSGCNRDSDNDGVIDGIDQCEDTPKGAAVNPRGCPIDADRDGIPDGLDRCSDTKPGVMVDNSGCALDSDADGVPDSNDRCPSTAAGAKVDTWGCSAKPAEAAPAPIPAPQPVAPPAAQPAPRRDTVSQPKRDTAAPAAGDTSHAAAPPAPAPAPTPAAPRVAISKTNWVIPGSVWPYRGAVLDPSAFPTLDSIVAVVKTDSTAIVEVNGFAYDRLVAADNTRLSQFRADAVKSYLVFRGVPVSRVTARGRGSQPMLDKRDTEVARTANRRVEIRITHPPK